MKNSDGYKPFPKMSDEEWRNLWNLVRLAVRKNYGELPKKIGGVEIEAEILDAIEDAFFGRRRYPVADSKGNEVSVFTFIYQIVRSEISHIVAREKKRPHRDTIPSPISRFGLKTVKSCLYIVCVKIATTKYGSTICPKKIWRRY